MLKPLPNYVLVEPIKDTEKTSVGVYLPETAKDKPAKGIVIDKSPIVFNNARDLAVLDDNISWTKELQAVKVGSIVYYKKWGNEEIKIEGKELVFVKYDDLLGVE